MKIQPKTETFCITERRILHDALTAFVANERRRLPRLKRLINRLECQDSIAMAEDLLNNTEFFDFVTRP